MADEVRQGTGQDDGARPFRPGAAWRDGKLYEFDHWGVTVLRPWPRPAAWRRTRTRPWKGKRPRIHLSRPGDPLLLAELIPADAARQAFEDAIPEPIRVAVARFEDRHWHLLSMVGRCDGALDLLHSTPALAYGLASNWVFHRPAVQRPMRAARSLLKRKQTEILAWLGFPGTKAVRNILRKLTYEAIVVGRLLYLRRCLHDLECRKLLAHLPVIGPGTIRVVSDEPLRRAMAPSALAGLARNDQLMTGVANAYTLRDTLRMAESLGQDRTLRFTTLEQMLEVHDMMVERTNRAYEERLVTEGHPDLRTFARPPVPGTDDIVPLDDERKLIEEGLAQHHCIASYAEEVAEGDAYVYRMLRPERATVLLRRGRGAWYVAEVRGPHNREPMPATQDVLDRWLSEAEEWEWLRRYVEVLKEGDRTPRVAKTARQLGLPLPGGDAAPQPRLLALA